MDDLGNKDKVKDYYSRQSYLWPGSNYHLHVKTLKLTPDLFSGLQANRVNSSGKPCLILLKQISYLPTSFHTTNTAPVQVITISPLNYCPCPLLLLLNLMQTPSSTRSPGQPLKECNYMIFTSPCTYINFLLWNISPPLSALCPSFLPQLVSFLALPTALLQHCSFYSFLHTPASFPSLHGQFQLSPQICTWFAPSYHLYLSLMSLLREVFFQSFNHQSLKSFTISKSFLYFLYSTYRYWKLT